MLTNRQLMTFLGSAVLMLASQGAKAAPRAHLNTELMQVTVFFNGGDRETEFKDENLGVHIILDTNYKTNKIVSNRPIVRVSMFGYYETASELLRDCYGGRDTVDMKVSNLYELTINYRNKGYIETCGGSWENKSIVVSLGGSNNGSKGQEEAVLGTLRGATTLLSIYYQNVLRSTGDFEKNIASSQRVLLRRLKYYLQQGIELTQVQKNKKMLPVTDVQIQENARIIMVVSSVIEALSKDYEDTPWASSFMPVLKNLEPTIRAVYGWNAGIAGQGSKVYRAIGEIAQIELRNIFNNLAEVGDENRAHQVFKLVKLAGEIRTKSELRGDVVAVDSVNEFIGIWNSTTNQQLMTSLLNAKLSDVSVAKLQVLFTAVESMAAYGGSRVTTPQLGK